MLGLYPVADVRAAEEEVMASSAPGSLMQKAAFATAVECSRLLREVRGSVGGARVTILVGSGNNGGDALFAGAELQRRGASVDAYAVSDRWHQVAGRALESAGGRVLQGTCDLVSADMVIDGIVGIGARGPLEGTAAASVMQANAADALRVAVDLPSGVDADSGHEFGDAVFEADLTVTFGCAKPGLFLAPGSRYAGAVRIVDIGIDRALSRPRWRVLELDDVLDHLPVPDAVDYKYSRGVVGVAAGSASYPGAAMLTTGGARYAGSGMTAIVNRGDGVATAVIRAFPDVVMVSGDPRMNERIRAWVCGPGMTGEPSDADMVSVLLDCAVPVVLDAGALRVLSGSEDLRRRVRERHDQGLVTVLTPHSGEYPPQETNAAADLGAIVVHKGPSSRIESPDSEGIVDTAGTPALACAGSGDVLAGLIAGMLAHGATRDHPTSRLETVAAAVWLHGMSGKFAARDDRPVLATDLIDVLPDVIAGARMGTLPW